MLRLKSVVGALCVKSDGSVEALLACSPPTLMWGLKGKGCVTGFNDAVVPCTTCAPQLSSAV